MKWFELEIQLLVFQIDFTFNEISFKTYINLIVYLEKTINR
jgi:hypothetical protein